MAFSQAQDIETRLDEIKSSMIDNNFETSLKQCEALLESGVSDTTQLALLYGYTGLSNEVLGNKMEAISYYQKAVELQFPQLDIYDKLIALSKKEKLDSIYEFALLEKLKAFPEYNQEITKSLAYLYVNTKQYEKLLSSTNQLLEWYPENVNYLYFKGIALENLTQVEEAKKFYKETLKFDAGHVGANMSLGMILYKEGSEIFASEKKKYESKAKPDRVDYLNYNKGIEAGKNIYKEALPCLLKAYESGSYPALKQVLFNTYVRLEQKDKAEAYR